MPGRQVGKKTMLDNLKQMDLDKGYFAVISTVAEEEAREYGEMLEKELGLKVLFYGQVSLIIGVHVGPNALGVAFIRNPK